MRMCEFCSGLQSHWKSAYNWVVVLNTLQIFICCKMKTVSSRLKEISFKWNNDFASNVIILAIYKWNHSDGSGAMPWTSHKLRVAKSLVKSGAHSGRCQAKMTGLLTKWGFWAWRWTGVLSSNYLWMSWIQTFIWYTQFWVRVWSYGECISEIHTKADNFGAVATASKSHWIWWTTNGSLISWAAWSLVMSCGFLGAVWKPRCSHHSENSTPEANLKKKKSKTETCFFLNKISMV